MQLNTTRLTVSIFLLMLVTLTNAHQCYVCGIDGNLSCDNFNTRNNIFIQDCPPDFKACGIQTDGSSVRRSCENMRLQDCQMANGVEYCYCTTTLCNDSKIKSVPTTDDEDMLEGSGEGTVITIQTKHKDKPTNVSNHLEFYFCNTYILVLALLCKCTLYYIVAGIYRGFGFSKRNFTRTHPESATSFKL